MTTFVSDFEPRALWRRFDEILTVYRPSKGEEAMRRHVTAIADAAGLEHRRDEAGNLVVAKPGAPRLRPSTLLRMRRWLSKRPTRPQSMASASPRWTISEAMVVLERRTMAFEASGVMPRRPMSLWYVSQ